MLQWKVTSFWMDVVCVLFIIVSDVRLYVCAWAWWTTFFLLEYREIAPRKPKIKRWKCREMKTVSNVPNYVDAHTAYYKRILHYCGKQVMPILHIKIDSIHYNSVKPPECRAKHVGVVVAVACVLQKKPTAMPFFRFFLNHWERNKRKRREKTPKKTLHIRKERTERLLHRNVIEITILLIGHKKGRLRAQRMCMVQKCHTENYSK